MQAAGTLPPETLKILENISKIRNDAIWIWNLQTNEVCRFGETFYQAFGKELTANPSPEAWKKLIHPDERERVVNNYKTAISDPETRQTKDTYHVLKTDANYTVVQEHIYIYRNENDVAITMYGMAT